jgi:hypothetical protein
MLKRIGYMKAINEEGEIISCHNCMNMTAHPLSFRPECQTCDDLSNYRDKGWRYLNDRGVLKLEDFQPGSEELKRLENHIG